METRSWQRPLWTYVLPTFLLLGSLGQMLLVDESVALIGDNTDSAWGFIVAPVLAFMIGFILRPEHSWITPLAVSLGVAIGIVAARLLGVLEEMDLHGHLLTPFLISPILIVPPFSCWIGLGKMASSALGLGDTAAGERPGKRRR